MQNDYIVLRRLDEIECHLRLIYSLLRRWGFDIENNNVNNNGGGSSSSSSPSNPNEVDLSEIYRRLDAIELKTNHITANTEEITSINTMPLNASVDIPVATSFMVCRTPEDGTSIGQRLNFHTEGDCSEDYSIRLDASDRTLSVVAMDEKLGDVEVGTLSTDGNINASGNLSCDHINATGDINALNAVVSCAHCNLSGNVTASGNVSCDHINATGDINALNGNVSCAHGNFSGNINAPNGKLTCANIDVTGSIAVNENIVGKSINSSGNLTGDECHISHKLTCESLNVTAESRCETLRCNQFKIGDRYIDVDKLLSDYGL